MLFNYEAIDKSGAKQTGSIDAVSREVAITSLQRRDLSITSVEAAVEDGKKFGLSMTLFESVSTKDVVLLSREIATLFEAQVGLGRRRLRRACSATTQHAAGAKC